MILFVVSAIVTVAVRAQTPTRASSAIGDTKVGPGSLLKRARSETQKKLSSQLLDEIARSKDLTASTSTHRQETGVKIDDRRRALVDVRAAVTTGLGQEITTIGGSIVSSVSQYDSTIAWVPLLMLERLASNPSVKAIQPAAEAALQ